MKKLLTILLLGLANYVLAQGPEIVNMPEKPFNLIVDSLFSNIDKSAVTSGVWYDRSISFANLHNFNGIHPDTATRQIYEQSYLQLYNATYSITNRISPNDQRDLKYAVEQQGNIPIGIINYNYQYLDTASITNNLIYQSGGLYYDNPNRTTSPWRSKLLTMAAVLADSVVDEGEGVNFLLYEPFVLENGSKTISTIQIDFGDGNGFRTVNYGGTVNVSYQQNGLKRITYLITYSDNTQITTYSAILTRYAPTNLERVFCGNRIQYPISMEATIPFQGYTEASARKGRGDVTIFYHHSTNCETVLRKPVIIIDGFDPGSERKAYFSNKSTLYSQMVFLNPSSGQRENLVDSLNGMGYDVVMLDFPKYQIGTVQIPYFQAGTFLPVMVSKPVYIDGGSDYIERNAMVLVHLIDSINNKLLANQSTEKLVVFGPSMGGLIARYALSYMEKNNMTHNTRLFVSFDAPHQGANIALGDQLYINFFADQNSEAKVLRDEQLLSTAAKQMLRFHFETARSSIFNPVYNFRNRFQMELDDICWPTNLRKVAVANGSIAGATTGSGCQTAFETETRVDFLNIRVAKATVRYIPSVGGDCKVFEGSHFLFASSYHRMSGLSANIAGIDNAPGSIVDTQGQIADQAAGDVKMETWPKLTMTTTFSNVQRNHCFIPTVSALAINDGFANSPFQVLNNRNLVSTAEVPFDSYYAPEQNETHLFFSPCNIEYLIRELNEEYQTPVGAEMSISGASSFTDTATYVVANKPSWATVTWSVNPYNIAAMSVTGNSVKLTKTFYGQVTLTATVTSQCGTKVFTKVIQVEQGPTQIVGVNFVCKTTPQVYYVQNLSPTASVSWSIPSSAGGVLSLSQNNPTTNQLTITNMGWYSVQTLLTATVTDNGIVTTYTLPVAADSYNAGGSYVQDAGWVGSSSLPAGSGYASSGNSTFVYPYNEVRVQLSLNQFEQIAYVAGPAPRYWYYNSSNGLLTFSLPTGYSSGIPFTWQVTKASGGCPANITFFSYYVAMNSFAAYPNPASSSITVSQNDESNVAARSSSVAEKSESKSFSVKLLNQSGSILFQSSSGSGRDIIIDTQSIANGTYLLHITKEKDVIKKQIIIQH